MERENHPPKGLLLRGLAGFGSPTTVPKRFSIGAFLGITTVWSLMVLGLQSLNAVTMVYWFFGIQLFLVCLAQMRFEKSPRWASFLVGGIVLYLVVLVASFIPFRQGLYPSTLFTVSQFIGFWGGDTYFVYRAANRRVDTIWFSRPTDEIISFALALGVGGFYGYALGTFTASVFMIGNRLSDWLQPKEPYSDNPPHPTLTAHDQTGAA